MSDILLVKTSSLGDLIHNMPALMEARRHRPQARFTWIVEEAYLPLMRLNPFVDRLVPIAWRRWRKQLHRMQTWREMRAFVRAVRARRYDAIIDSQGLIRSALVACCAQGPRHGYDAQSIRERAASYLYNKTHHVGPWLEGHVIARNRMLTALSLGYEVSGPPEYGLDRKQIASAADAPYAVIVHSSARASKQWPEENWRAVVAALAARGLKAVLLWGNADERGRSERIAEGHPNAEIPPLRPVDQVTRLIAGAQIVVGGDTGFTHIAAALGVPTVAIFLSTSPKIAEAMGPGPVANIYRGGEPPSADEVKDAAARLLA
ncbi:MAG: lipopolysaccharide heptosyltransferase I [Pseudorhodoplanes sp.]